MYEVLDKDRMKAVKAQHVRERRHLPKLAGIYNADRKPKWVAMILVSSGTSMDKLKHLPGGCEIKLCMLDKAVWEILVPTDFKDNKELLAKRLDAIAFL
tara:strand:+ start:12044 stop:12340 length:297 start_codon:yes stop_codon:yes gene_type:complete